MGRIVAIDFGRKRLGIALSDERKIIASPLFIQPATHSLKETALALKDKLTVHFPLEKIVIGLPLHLSGKESEISELVRKFAPLLEEVFALPVIFWDERLTSKEVERAMLSAEVKRKKRAEKSDCLAACLILQNYLNTLATC